MAGIESIIWRIENDAKEKARQILDNANERAQEILKKAEGEARAMTNDILSKSETEALEVKRRIFMAAELDMRKELLAAKQEMIEEAFEEAMCRIQAMDISTYQAYIKRWLLATDLDGEVQIIISDSDKERITPEFIADVNSELKMRGSNLVLHLSDEHRDIRGGFILNKGDIEINSSIEALMRASRDELEPEVAHVMFGSEVR